MQQYIDSINMALNMDNINVNKYINIDVLINSSDSHVLFAE